MAIVFADNRIGMLRAIVINMRDRLLQVIDYSNRQNGRDVFGIPVILTRLTDTLAIILATAFAATQLDTFVPGTRQPDQSAPAIWGRGMIA